MLKEIKVKGSKEDTLVYEAGKIYKFKSKFANTATIEEVKNTQEIYQKGIEQGKKEYKELFLKLLDEPYSSNPSMLTEEGLKILLRQEIKKL